MMGAWQDITSRLATSAAGLAGGADYRTAAQTAFAVLRDPGKDPRLALVVASCLVVVLLLLIVLVVLALTPPKRRVVIRRVVRTAGAPAAAPAPQPPSSAEKGGSISRGDRFFLAATAPLAVAAYVAVLAAVLYGVTSTDWYCARTCHGASENVRAALAQPHAACVSCHESYGPFGVLPNVSARLRMAAAAASGRRSTGALVDSTACLRCHDGVRRGTLRLAGGLRVSHREYLGERACVACHASAGHSTRAYTASMSPCIVCHDGRQASAECVTCHAADPVAATFASNDSTATIGSGRIAYTAVRAARRDCGGCHDVAKQCDPCHRVRMPHTTAFVDSGHARAAAFSGKLVCYRCHATTDCGTCHSGGFDPKTGLGGHPDWVAGHARADWSAGCACHEGRSVRRGPMCALCHDATTHALLPVRP